MRIGFICDLTEQDFKFAADNGFKCVEFNGADNVEFTRQDARELAGLINSAANQKEKPDVSVRLFRKYRDFTYRIIHR